MVFGLTTMLGFLRNDKQNVKTNFIDYGRLIILLLMWNNCELD